ncbi:DNA-binding transcriptional LysR family regulator [Parapusillimonas granuli]|uniref:LysR family transcriptional regulator n=2 Tax=Parapusillimonas granuli TaxID=380911 RepID=A0A853FTJ2_9BURK|nr:LysR substrate-binding domain-containing protein [Parapusillimonas granuli]MBB5216246.1 DNA-binding transcriptional LysR family regulator [Parapusillimonas granuli]MEB2400520.1 LysR substrate-binding domain-containing protein [Alcaligenaceae bacterium]NYT47923.1 LysR family transcriptional regulator [Parapusillimonas granuli]
MKMVWIEDLIALAEAGTFSRAAVLRNVSQPAFSRRIQLFEAWLNAELIDRRSQPIRLTPIGERHIAAFRSLLHDMNQLRNRIQSESAYQTRVTLATQHSLTITLLPGLLQQLNDHGIAHIDFNVRSENRDECVAAFMLGQADLLLCMEEKHDLLSDRMPAACRHSMGVETLIPVSARTAGGAPLHMPRAGQALKLLGFPQDSFLGRVVQRTCLGTLSLQHPIEIVHESIFLAGVKEMVKSGFGMAWLPRSLVRRELESGELLSLADSPGLKTVEFELGLYRNPLAAHADATRQVWDILASEPETRPAYGPPPPGEPRGSAPARARAGARS